MPGDFVEIQNDQLQKFNGEVAIEPHGDTSHTNGWPIPSISRVIQGSIRLSNLNNEPIQIPKSQHIALIRLVITPMESPTTTIPPKCQTTSPVPPTTDFPGPVSIDPNGLLSTKERDAF